MIRLTLHSSASPAEVLAALRAHAGEWRESQIPDDLRRGGIIGVDYQARGAVSSLRYARMSRDVGPELTAVVASDPAGGTRVDVRVGYRPVPRVMFVGAALFGAGGAWLFAGSPLMVMPSVMAGALVAFHIALVRESNAAILAREREPGYLIERVERAVESAGVASTRSPTSWRYIERPGGLW